MVTGAPSGADDLTEVLPDALTKGLATIAQVVGVILAGSGAAAAGTLEVLRQASVEAVRPTLLSAVEAQEALRRGAMTEEQYRETMDRLGFSAPAQDVWRGLLSQLLDAGSLVSLTRRGELGDGEYLSSMARLGYTEADALALYKLSEYIPPAQDVIQFAVREIYSPEIAEKFGQYEGFPEDAMPDFLRAGISREQATKYWAAHWQLPSPSQVMEMIHRDAETGATVEDLRTLLRAADVMPFWREKFIALATNPFTRVDIRRMHKVGVLSTEELPRAYRDIGYNEDRAQKLADFTVTLNRAEDDSAAEPWRASLRSRSQTLYVDGILSPDELAEVLSAIGHTDEEIAFYIAESQFILDGDRARDLRGGLKSLYVGGYWSAGKVATRMLEAGYEQMTIDHLIQTWDLAKEVRDASAEDRAQKDLTRSDILGALGDGILGEAEARSALMDLGYDDHEATVLIQREKLKGVQAERKRVETVARGAFLAGKIDEHDARGLLGQHEIPTARIEALLLTWTSEVQATAPTLTQAQVTAAVKRGIIPREEAARRLDRMGYSIDDRNILLDLAGKDETP